MNAEQFLKNFAIKGKEYELYEYSTILNIIRYCDTDTRNTFFPNAVPMSGYDYGYPETAIKLICYTIGRITSYGFNKAVVHKSYPESVGCLFQNNSFRWTYLFKKFVTDIYADGTDAGFANTVFQAASTGQFITGSLIKMEAESELPVRLVFEFVRCFCPERFCEFYSRWEQAAGAEKVGQFKTPDYFPSYIKNDMLSDGIKGEIEAAISIQTNKGGNDYAVGEGVKKWLDSWLVSQYGLRSAEKICNYYDASKPAWSDGPSGGGCVTAETLIAMADGTYRPICDIEEGSQILSEGGCVSQTSDERIINRHLDRLYGINGIPPFMSLEHAVMTLDGWKSLDPVTSNAINPHFHVGLLKKGDIAVTLTGNVTIETITVQNARPGQYFTGYDLHFREGRNSYFANGILVLLNYPEITCSRILRNIKSMEEGERKKLLELVNSHGHLFNQAFGMDIMRYMKEDVYDKL
ncbi:MAG: hypothetical protein K2O45_17300 [Oscillospiraceae bacterium]|nr:hypothetical protein [Oscillospiraceae bacterium]